MSDDIPATDRPLEPEPPEVRRHAGQLRLGILTAVDDAIRRRDEVWPLIAAASDSSAARTSIADLLGTTRDAAGAVLDLQWSALLPDRRARIARDRADQQRTLED